MNKFPSNRACVRKAVYSRLPEKPGEGIRRAPTLELAEMSPAQFLRMENWGKRKKRKISLAPVSITK